MPSEPIPITRASQSPGPESPEEQRAAREARVKAARQSVGRKAAEARMQTARSGVLREGRIYRDARTAQNRSEEAKALLQSENPDLDGGGFVSTLGAVLIGMVKWMAIFTIDLCLLAGISHFLISLAYVSEKGPPWQAMVVVPAALFGLELVVAAHMAMAERAAESGGPSSRRTLWLWRLFGGVLSIVVPVLGTAALISVFDAAELGITPGIRLLLVIGVITLAAVCHGSVIFGGASALGALAKLLFLPRLAWVDWRIWRSDRAAQAAQDRAHDAMIEYEKQVDDFRRVYAEVPAHLFIPERDRELIDAVLGEITVARPAEVAASREASGQLGSVNSPPSRNTESDALE